MTPAARASSRTQAGHEVAARKPQHALVFFENFLADSLNATTVRPDSFVLSTLFPTAGSQVGAADGGKR